MTEPRKILVLFEVDDEKAMQRDLGTIEYLEKECQRLKTKGIILQYARILDDDDDDDKNALDLLDKIMEESEK